MSPLSGTQFNRAAAIWAARIGTCCLHQLHVRVIRLHDVTAQAGTVVSAAKAHAHSFFELSVVHRGAIAYEHAGETRRVAAGGTFAMPPGRRHSWRVAAGPALISGYQLQVMAAGAAVRGAPERWFERVVAEGLWTLPSHAYVAAAVTAMHDDAGGDDELGVQLVRAHLAWSLARLGAWDGRDLSDGVADAAIRARDHILANLSAPVPLRTLAKRLGASPRHLNRRFVALTGQPIHRYIIAQRLDRAVQSLISGDEPVAAISRNVGYPDPGYFGRLFRRRFGSSPERWRMAERRRRGLT